MQLIDAGMIAFSAWHALKGRVPWPLTFQVPRMLRPLVSQAGDTYAMFWNGEHLRKRKLWSDYRDRPEIWDEADREDYASMLRVLSALGVVQYRAEGWEADEVLAAVAHQLEGTEKLVLRSDDKDFFQLLSGSTWMEGRVRGTVRFSDVRGILGVSPAYVVDYLALAGDQADGIPRIVTPSVARKLIESRGHVRDWIDRDLRLPEKLKRTLEDKREQLRLNLELVDLSADAVGVPPDPLLDGWGDVNQAHEVGEKLGIGYLREPGLAEDFSPLRKWGKETIRCLGFRVPRDH